jgi:hypothetical protein
MKITATVCLMTLGISCAAQITYSNFLIHENRALTNPALTGWADAKVSMSLFQTCESAFGWTQPNHLGTTLVAEVKARKLQGAFGFYGNYITNKFNFVDREGGAGIAYAWRKNITEKTVFSAGIRTGFLFSRWDYNNLNGLGSQVPSSPTPPSKSYFVPDLDLGLALTSEKLWLAMGVRHILNTDYTMITQDGTNSESKTTAEMKYRDLNLQAGYRFLLKKEMAIHSSVLVNRNKNDIISHLINEVWYKNMFMLGGYLNSANEVAINAGIRKKGFTLTAAFSPDSYNKIQVGINYVIK